VREGDVVDSGGAGGRVRAGDLIEPIFEVVVVLHSRAVLAVGVVRSGECDGLPREGHVDVVGPGDGLRIRPQLVHLVCEAVVFEIDDWDRDVDAEDEAAGDRLEEGAACGCPVED